MVWTYRGRAVPLDVYHGVPRGWGAKQIVAEHARLGGTFDLTGPEATEPGAPAWLPERYSWLQYRQMLRRVGEGIFQGDAACVEIAVRYIVLRYIGSYSGFLPQMLARRLKHATLNEDQRRRLCSHFAQLVIDGERTDEFREYAKLWRKIATTEEVQRLIAELRRDSNNGERARWLETLFAS
jgi:hypothetical protein